MTEKRILVLDGHDGSGKTTLAARLAEALGGVHARPLRGSVGELFLWSAERGEGAFASALAQRAVARALERAGDAPVVVFDRHWMTVFSVVHEAEWPAWEPRPRTVLCWADLDATMSRLDARDQGQWTRAEHARWLEVYRGLAERFGVPLLRTDDRSVDDALDWLVAWERG